MATRTIADVVTSGGLPQNGITLSAYKASRVTGVPALGTAPPAGAADATVVSGLAFGGPGEFQLVCPTQEDYYVTGLVANQQVWQFYPFAAPVGGGVASVAATDATAVIGGTGANPTIGVGVIPESKVTNLPTDLAAKMTNPMTASQDLIVGGAGGAPTRLPLGPAGQVLTNVGGVLGYAAAGAGGGVSTVTAADATAVIGGTAANPTVAVGQIPESKVTNQKTLFLQAIIDRCITPNLMPTGLPNEGIYPGTDYRPGGIVGSNAYQFLWDSCFAAKIAADRGLGATHAQLWLQNWVSKQQTGAAALAGMYPEALKNDGTVYANISQAPLVAWATYQVYLKTGDTAFLKTMYPSLQRYYRWWEVNRDDTSAAYGQASNLAAWGVTAGFATTALAQGGAAAESGQDLLGTMMDVDRQYLAIDTVPVGKFDHCSPDLNALLCLEANYIATMASVLTGSYVGDGTLGTGSYAGDLTAYVAKRDNRKAAMNAVMWDDEQKCYQMPLRNDLAATSSLTCSGGAAIGATTITLSGPLTGPMAPGLKLAWSNGATCQIGLAGQKVGDTVLNLLLPLTVAVAATNTFKMRWFAYPKSLANLMLPLFASVASQIQAEAIVTEHLLREFTGTEPQTASVFFGTGYEGAGTNRLLKLQHWEPKTTLKGYLTQTPTAANLTSAVDGVVVNGAGSAIVFPLASNTQGAALRAPHQGVGPNTPTAGTQWPYEYKRSWRPSTPGGPITIALTYDPPSGNASSYPEIWMQTDNPFSDDTVNGANSGAVVIDQILSGGTSGVTKTDVVTDGGGGNSIWAMQLKQPAGNNSSFKLRRLDVTVYPRGFSFRSPHGLLCSSRLADLSYGRPESDVPHQGGSEGGQPDFWNGTHWVNLEFMAIQGLLNYGMNVIASQIAHDVIKRVYSEWVRSGQFYEYYSMRGRGMGSADYAWAGLAGSLIDLFGMPVT